MTLIMVKDGDAWKLTSGHVAIHFFDNPMIDGFAAAGKKVVMQAGVGAGIAGLVIGFILAGILGKRKEA